MKHEFEIDGSTFRLSALKLKQALKAEAILVQAGLPALAAGHTLGEAFDPGALAALVGGLERVEELVAMFVEQCEVKFNGKDFVILKPWLEQTFERKNALLLAWLVECVTWQFADFFEGNGLQLLVAQVERFASRISSTGGSGE